MEDSYDPSLMTLGILGEREVLTSVLSWIALQARISCLIVTVNLHPPWLGGSCASMARVWCLMKWCLKHNLIVLPTLIGVWPWHYRLKWRQWHLAGRVVWQLCAMTGSSSTVHSQTRGLPRAPVVLFINGFGHSQGQACPLPCNMLSLYPQLL